MGNFNQKITRIKKLSDRRRLPRLGSIRLGIKRKSAKTGNEYPTEVDFFVCPPEVQAVYGLKPDSLDVMIPINEIDAVFPQAYKYYGSSKGLKCQGNGEIAYRVNEQTREMEEVQCPCELLDAGKCKQMATLMVMLPRVSVGGVYQIRTSSYNSIVDVNSGLDYVSALLGRFAMVPLTLRRVKTETHHDEKKQNHYTLQIVFDGNIETLNQLRADTQRILEHPRYQLPAPKDDNPEFDPPDEIIDLEDEQVKTEKPPETQPQASKSQPGSHETESLTVNGVIEKVDKKEGDTKGKKWLKYGIKVGESFYGTFDTKLGEEANRLLGQEVILSYKKDGKFFTALGITAMEPPADEPPPFDDFPPDEAA